MVELQLFAAWFAFVANCIAVTALVWTHFKLKEARQHLDEAKARIAARQKSADRGAERNQRAIARELRRRR